MSQPALDFGDDDVADDEGNPTYTVGELADAVNGVLRRHFSDGVWVRGEIQGWSERNGHAYFRLVEHSDAGRAAIDVSFFSSARQRLRPLLNRHRLRLDDGLKVRIWGHLDLYAPSGRLSVKMAGLDPRYTLGDLAGRRDEVVRRLVASGMFDAQRRLRLGVAPVRVGVVTSVSSAAWADFAHEIERSGIGFRLRVMDVRVQGEWAPRMISRAVRSLADDPDLDAIVVIRGGGSRTELAVFDDESIALAIASSPLPVLTGLGHEIDRSVADDVAHLALKTPTACAAALVEQVQAYRARTEVAWVGVAQAAIAQLERAQRRLAASAGGVRSRTVRAVERSDQRLSFDARRAKRACETRLRQAEQTAERATRRLGAAPARHLAAGEHRLGELATRARLLDPARTLARGWSITRRADGTIVTSPGQVSGGDIVVTSVAGGTVISRAEAGEGDGR